MIQRIIISFLFLIVGINIYGQNGNVIIQVNGKLITDGLANTYVKVNDDGTDRSFDVSYVPGKIAIRETVWEFIERDSSGTFDFHFDYYTFKRQKTDIKNFKVELSKGLLEKEYLIINIYDFRNRKYRKWYGPYTEEEYLVEFRYPNGPMYPPYK